MVIAPLETLVAGKAVITAGSQALIIPPHLRSLGTIDYIKFAQMAPTATGASGILFAKETPVYTGFNTTVDPNGFLKAASPIVKLFGDGSVSSLHFRRDLLLKRIFSIVSLSIVLPLVTETSSIDAIRTVA